MRWLLLWRRWVAWQRSLFLALGKKDQIKWTSRLKDLFEIINRALTLGGYPMPKTGSVETDDLPELTSKTKQDSKSPYEELTTEQPTEETRTPLLRRRILKRHPRSVNRRRK